MTKVTKELPSRSDIPEELTWNLEDIFATDELWEEELNELINDIPKIEKYKGTLGSSAQHLYDLFQLQDQLSERIGKLYTYARMRYDEDTTNSFYQSINSRAENALTLASSAMSYIVPEILDIEEETIDQFLKDKDELKLYERSEEHTSELQSRGHLVCRLLLEKKNKKITTNS